MELMNAFTPYTVCDSCCRELNVPGNRVIYKLPLKTEIKLNRVKEHVNGLFIISMKNWPIVSF